MDENDLEKKMSFLKDLMTFAASNAEFGMEQASDEQYREFSRIEDLSPGDFVRKIRDDGKRWPDTNDVVKVYDVFKPYRTFEKYLAEGKHVTYDFSVLLRSKSNHDELVEFLFDSRCYRKTLVGEVPNADA